MIAPDLVGFGKSDKPAAASAHTYQAHVDWMTGLVRQLGLSDAAAFMQDWGGLIGLRVLAAEPEWLSRLRSENPKTIFLFHGDELNSHCFHPNRVD